MPTIELTIRGRVQGVFYRASTKRKAEELGLEGWVKNEPGGSVRLQATGSAAALGQLEAWCAIGPPGAVVSAIEKKELAEMQFSGFAIIRD